MSLTSILYIVLAFIFSLCIGYFQYFYTAKNTSKKNYILLIIKSLAVFLLVLLLINPTIKTSQIENTKPVLSILVDNTKSIAYFKDTAKVNYVVNQLKNDALLNNKFNIKDYYFDATLSLKDTMSFTGANTNIYEAILQSNALYKNEIAPIVLLSDGNQTIGDDYSYIASKQQIYPMIFGDTTTYKDLKISQINVNKYSYVKNKFPVEVLLNYEGKEKVTTQFKIYNQNKVVFSKRLNFSATKNSISFVTNLTSFKEGVHYYKASLQKITDEKNIKNNTKNFSIEVIDEQTKILLLTSVIHPDIGALKKAIESNKQRNVTVATINKFKEELNDYQLIILFGVNKKFNAVINALKENNNSYFLISGTTTDWNFINQKQLGFNKNVINQTENYTANYSSGFQTFYQKDIGFNDFSPLKDKFGDVKINKEHQTLLFQNIHGITTQQPLLVTFEENNQKAAILLGEGIWKWRANSFLTTNSFQDFDTFVGNFVQYLASNKKRSRLDVQADKLFPANVDVTFNAFYTDKNYKFDARASLEIFITNKNTKETIQQPFSLINNTYKTSIGNLPSGNYTYKVSVAGQNINRFGSFKITDYDIEAQFTNANQENLKQLAKRTGGKHYYKSQFENLKQDLLSNKKYYTIQKSTLKEKNLIDWKWILFLVIGLFSVEWFIRKYHGKI